MARLRRDKQGRFVLPSGEKISKEQEQAFRRAVVNVNKKRNRLIEKLPKSTNEKHLLFGGENEWLFSKKSQALGRFNNLREFQRYYANIRKIKRRDYISNRMGIYRENYYRALRTTFGKEKGDILVNMVESLRPKDFAKLTLNETLESIGYVYDNNISFKKKYTQLEKSINQILKENESRLRPVEIDYGDEEDFLLEY